MHFGDCDAQAYVETAQRERAIADARRKEQELRLQAAEAARIAGAPPRDSLSIPKGHRRGSQLLLLRKRACKSVGPAQQLARRALDGRANGSLKPEPDIPSEEIPLLF